MRQRRNGVSMLKEYMPNWDFYNGVPWYYP
jgi:hypothetical protein